MDVRGKGGVRVECLVWDLAVVDVSRGNARGAARVGGWWYLLRVVVVANCAGDEVVEGFGGVRGLRGLDIAFGAGWCFFWGGIEYIEASLACGDYLARMDRLFRLASI